MLKDDFAKSLFELRVLKQLTRKEICDRIDLSYRTYEKWERGERVPPLYLQKLILEFINNM